MPGSSTWKDPFEPRSRRCWPDAEPTTDTTAGRVFNDLRNLARRTGRGTDELLLAYSLETFFSGDAIRGEDQAALPRSSADRLADVRRLWTPRWAMIHAAAVILVLGFLGLGWWQVRRAADGNTLSFGYAIEWPIFAAFVLYVWVKEIRRTLRESARPEVRLPAGRTTVESPAWPPAATAAPNGRRRRNEAAYDDSGDEDLAAYNRYLAWLNAHPHASPTEYPG